ncbi:MAG: M1 family aminopeptidase [Bacteroidales bacterium]
METTHSIKRMAFILIFAISSFVHSSAQSYDLWEQNFHNALKSADVEAIKPFFTVDFCQRELDTWKYELRRGHLNFNATKIIRLNTDAVLLHIPTNNTPYDGDNHDEYFDFIYRVYKLENKAGNYFLTERVMDDFTPDFIDYKLNLNVNPGASFFSFDCNITMSLQSHHLLFKLAKDFEIIGFILNGRKADYERFGYLVHCIMDTIGKCQVHITGRLKSPGTLNQFISMNSNSFFIRLGGFAAVPSPPPGNSGRNFFSGDSTHFEITYTYPDEFTLLQYGEATEKSLPDGKKETKSILDGTWMDDIAFYARNNWDQKEIVNGNTRIGFYFTRQDQKERDFVIAEVDTLLKWINRKFNNYGSYRINFVVLDNFTDGGLLNDGHSIVAQNAAIIGSDGIGYLHEVCHSAPKPTVAGNYLWISEGFTNFLSYEYLQEQKKDAKTWENQKRKYLHCFDLFEEPLINITSTSIPTYWSAYSKASWVFRMLESEIGRENFQKALFRMGTMAGTRLSSTQEYLEIFEQVSGQDLKKFEEQWLNRKQNPVLSVQGQLEINRGISIVKITVVQDEPYFTLHLEVEIKTKNNTFRKVIPVQGKTTVFEMPVEGNEIDIKYDPDARLFSIIKDQKKSFTEGRCAFRIPEDTVTYVSKEGNRQLKLWFSKSRKGIAIHKKDDNSESILELTDILSPIRFIAGSDTIFSQDINDKTIRFHHVHYDIAEPVYPKEFIPFLFSIIDWNDVDELSMLYLIPDSKNCQVIYCKSERGSSGEYNLTMQYPLSNDIVRIIARNGFPEGFRSSSGEEYSIEQATLNQR